MSAPTYDIGIHAKYLLPMSRKSPALSTVLENQFIGISTNTISVIKKFETVDKSHCKKFIDATNKIVMSGLINGHSHLAMTLLRGFADDLPFEDWLHKYILPVESRLVNPEFVTVGTELACLEMIATGTTTVCDMYYFSPHVASTLDTYGLRGIVGQTLVDFPAPDSKTDKDLPYKHLNQMVEQFNKHPRIQPCISPHAPYTCSDETFINAKKYSEKFDLILNCHVSETRHEIDESVKKYSKSPVQRLYDLGVMDSKSVFAHCIHVDEKDLKLFEKTNTAVVHNPESNLKLSCGIAPITRMKEMNLRVGLGTDSCASNNNLNLFGEIATAAKIHKIQHSVTAMSAIQTLELATIGGAEAFGLDEITGSIEVGKRADIIGINCNEPHMVPMYNVPSQLVYSTTGAEVEFTICDGQILYENRSFQKADSETVYHKVESFRQKIKNLRG